MRGGEGRGDAERMETEKDDNKKNERGEATCQKPPSRELPKGTSKPLEKLENFRKTSKPLEKD